MPNTIEPIFLDLANKGLNIEEITKPHHHHTACSCSGKCRVCRCKQKKEQR